MIPMPCGPRSANAAPGQYQAGERPDHAAAVQRLVYRQRNAVERFFNELKHFRAVATRCDKRDDNFLASVKLVALRSMPQDGAVHGSLTRTAKTPRRSVMSQFAGKNFNAAQVKLALGRKPDTAEGGHPQADRRS